jgi:hypothetical protein
MPIVVVVPERRGGRLSLDRREPPGTLVELSSGEIAPAARGAMTAGRSSRIATTVMG